ncbi:hypothetical protein AMJ52_08010 [candidate division TA06 bacterium DG_78]|uniref:Uncharacterized protein n=1 Tax=candidate division TA06 bacterium DG_78 TaxID=1703772 RepID=A0A0S7YAX3_UNCT6|nr:MAG: hypothetical protein AMJ52_08010 [candidate division TA06 bacterium DG_78]
MHEVKTVTVWRSNMRKIVALMLVFMVPGVLFAQQIESVPEKMTYDDGYAEGKQDGRRVSQTQWLAHGCAGGLLGACLGGGIVFLLASGDSPSLIPEGPQEFKVGYVEGYKDATKSRKKQKALIGAIAGTVISVVALVVFMRTWEWELKWEK